MLTASVTKNQEKCPAQHYFYFNVPSENGIIIV